MKNTGIQWTDDTCNPTSGCDGCELWIPGQGGRCYAGNLHETRLAKSLPLLYDKHFHNIRLIPGRVEKSLRCMDLAGRDRPNKPWLNGLRRKIFVGDLCDIFSQTVPFNYIKEEIIDLARSTIGSRHDIQLLTKQPNRASQFAKWLGDWPDNVWIGTSITSKASLGRINDLAMIPAKHKFLSLEPLISDSHLTPKLIAGIVDWIIIGGESDQGQFLGRPFNIQWAHNIIKLGKKLDIAVFVKQLGSNPIDGNSIELKDHHGGDWNEWDEDLRVRQMPFTAS